MWSAIGGFLVKLLFGLFDRFGTRKKVHAETSLQAPMADRHHAGDYLRDRLPNGGTKGSPGATGGDEPGHPGPHGPN